MSSTNSAGTLLGLLFSVSESLAHSRGHFCPLSLLSWLRQPAVQIAESFSSVSSWLQRGHDVPWKKKKKWNRLERIRRLGLGFPRSKPFKRTKHKSSSFDCPNFSSKSLFLAALIQPCVSPGWRQECGLAVVHECFMTMSARCYVTGWCGTPGCVTVAIIHLGLSVGGQGRRARTGNWFFQDALDFSWC